MTALFEVVRAKLGITEPLTKPAVASPSPGLTSLADDLNQSIQQGFPGYYPRSLAPVPFRVPIAEIQDVPVTEAEKRELTALAPLAGKLPPPSDPTSGGGTSGKPIARANIQLELPKFDPKNLPAWVEEFAEFLLLTGQSHVDVTTKCSLLKRSYKGKFLQKQVRQIVKTYSTWAEVLQRLEKTFPVYEMDLNVRTQIEELPMLPEFHSAACISEYLCDVEYLFSWMNVGSYAPAKPHLWLEGKTSLRTWEDCTSDSKRKRRTHTYNDLVDLLIELALERENDCHMEKFLKRHLRKGANPTLHRGESRGSKTPTKPSKGGGKGGCNLRAMNEVKPDTRVPSLFYCKPVNDKGGPCHAPDCDHRAGCELQLKRQHHTKDRKTVNHEDHFRCTITCGFCGKCRHYEDECCIKRRETDKLKRQEAERQKNQTPSRTPKNGDKGGKGGGKGGGKDGTADHNP